jgi:DNA-binding CsgD family transcriptional regulator
MSSGSAFGEGAFGRALFSLHTSDAEWLECASNLLVPALPAGEGDTWVALCDRRDGMMSWSERSDGDDGRRMALEFPRTTVSDLFERIARLALTTVTTAKLWTEASRDFFSDIRYCDAVALSSLDDDGGVIAGRLLSQNTARAPRNRWTTVQLSRSVRAAWRLRRWASRSSPFEVADAVFAPSGAVLHASREATSPSALEALRAAVVRRERRDFAVASPMDGAAAWSELVSGRWSLVDDFEAGGRRYILAIRNDTRADVFALSASEARTLELSVVGRSPKQIVDDLGLSLSTVYGSLQSAVRKLQGKSLADVIALARQLPDTVLSRVSLQEEALVALRFPRAAASRLSSLTDAEREVLADLLGSVAPHEIARRRLRSPRTVANQIQSIYRKLGVSGRRELVMAVRACAV